MTEAGQRPSPLALWVGAARLKTLPAAAAPVVLGTAFAAGDGAFHGAAALCALVSALLIQVGTNYANDAEDAVRGADTAERVGPKRAVNEGWVTAGQMRRAAAVAFGLAFLVGLYLVWRGGPPVLALGLVAIASGYAYTKGRYALAYTGLADLFVLVFFGPVAVGGTYFVQALALPAWVLVAGLGPGALATAILIANNVRDVEQDRAASKRTLVVRFGRPFGIGLYTMCFILAGSVVQPARQMWRYGLSHERSGVLQRLQQVADPRAALDSLRAHPLPDVTAHAGALVAAVVAFGAMAILGPALNRAHGAAAGPILGKTAAVLMAYSLAFALGWWLT
ncbi:MAG TPA: 1,4-dihydroxy-2-naphthoate octaprenyltransferase [Rubricoccaceae bacterium]